MAPVHLGDWLKLSDYFTQQLGADYVASRWLHIPTQLEDTGFVSSSLNTKPGADF
jgi:hypothetical protein